MCAPWDWEHKPTTAPGQKKAIAECMGRVYGNEMWQFVLNEKESTPTELVYPNGTNATDKDKAIWGER